MTIEIEAGASQDQFSMKPWSSARVFRQSSLGTAGYPTTDADLAQQGPFAEKATSFSKETPSLSLRLRLVKAFRGTIVRCSHEVEQHSSPFELHPIPIRTNMSNLNCHFKITQRPPQPALFL